MYYEGGWGYSDSCDHSKLLEHGSRVLGLFQCDYTVIQNVLSQLYCSLQITRHISPYEQQIVVPWLKTFPKRVSV